MLAKVFARAVKASFHCGDTGGKYVSNLGMAAALLDQRQQGAVLRAELGQRVAESVEFLGVHGTRRFRNVFVFLAERLENAPQLLAAELVDAGIAREAEKPRFELRGSLEPVDRPDHFDEDLLREVLDIIAPIRHGVNKSSHPVLVADNELALGCFLALLSPTNEVGQRSR
jgi:hypothetical protein